MFRPLPVPLAHTRGAWQPIAQASGALPSVVYARGTCPLRVYACTGKHISVAICPSISHPPQQSGLASPAVPGILTLSLNCDALLPAPKCSPLCPLPLQTLFTQPTLSLSLKQTSEAQILVPSPHLSVSSCFALGSSANGLCGFLPALPT